MIKIVKPFSRKKYNKLFYSCLKGLGVNITGRPKFIEDNVYIDPTNYGLLTIEQGVTVSRNVTLLVHDYSISNIFVYNNENVTGAGIFKPIVLKENCFVGSGAILLPGTIVGKNSIVGAGSVVKGTVPDNTVVAGNPAKAIKSLQEYYEKVNYLDSDYLKIWKKEG
ncbi:MAG: acyltransferase [Ruminococcus sp.]|nr:acyltransferase [Ruminococcus sp.]